MIQRKASRVGSTVRRVVLVDDHPIVRHGFADLINEEPDLDVIAEVATGEEAMRVIAEHRPELAVIDISLEGMDGLELIKHLKAQYPKLMVLVVSIYDESLYAERALRAGAMGYLNKQTAIDQIVPAIRRVLSGKVYLSPRVADRLLQQVVEGVDELEQSPVQRLSDRELEVYRLIGQGLTTRQIATQLHLSMKTIETYREHIKTKMNFKNSNEMVRHAVQWVLEQA
ncbi:MAG: response regulator transcription factor [Phycisphaeraceae bacterium]